MKQSTCPGGGPDSYRDGRRELRRVEMYFVYAIKSDERNYIYVGLTNDINRRLEEHNSGRNKTTKPYRPFKLIHKEELPDRKGARLREKYLKSGVGKEFLKSL